MKLEKEGIETIQKSFNYYQRHAVHKKLKYTGGGEWEIGFFFKEKRGR